MSGMKGKLKSHLPGHNKDANRNGIPDRLEGQQGYQTGIGGTGTTVVPVGGTAVIPGSAASTTTSTTTRDLSGLPMSGTNVINQQVITQETIRTEPTMIQTQPIITQTRAPVMDVREAPTVVQQVQKAPVIHEVIRSEEVVEIQPVIQREREKLDVYEVVQPIREREVIATEVRSGVLPAQTRATLVEDQSAFLAQRSVPGEFSTRDIAPTLHSTHQNAPIVHETIRHKVIEEVQPVIYKEIDRPVLIKETLPIYEKVVEAPQAHHSVLPMRDLGTRSVASTSFIGTDLNRNGIPDSLERQQGAAYRTVGLQSGLTTTGVLPTQQGLGFQQGTMGGMSDLNRNGIPDSMERQGLQSGFVTTGGLPGQQGLGGFQQGTMGGMTDFNRNGIPDSMERQQGLQSGFATTGGLPGQQGFQQGTAMGGMTDFNRNGIPDSMERQQGLQSGFATTGGLPGQQGLGGYQQGVGGMNDLNRNGIPDTMERQQGFGLTGGVNDRNANGIPDNLERQQGLQPGFANTGGLPGQQGVGGYQQGLPGQQGSTMGGMGKVLGLSDANANGIPDTLERRMGAASLSSTRL